MCLNLSSFALTPREKIDKTCQRYSEEEILSRKAPKCMKAVKQYLKNVLKDKVPRYDKGLYAYLFLGLRADIPEAFQVIEKEIYEGHLNDWIDKLEEIQSDVYKKSLVKWARHVEAEVRKIYNAKLSKNENYKIENEDTEEIPELMSIWSPILMTKYLNLLSKKTYKITAEDFESLNVIYAFSNSSYRAVFKDKTSKLILAASDNWVKSARKEQAWVLFRLFPLIPKNPDGNIKRELIWLSQYHQDYKIRSLASSKLRKISPYK